VDASLLIAALDNPHLWKLTVNVCAVACLAGVIVRGQIADSARRQSVKHHNIIRADTPALLHMLSPAVPTPACQMWATS